MGSTKIRALFLITVVVAVAVTVDAQSEDCFCPCMRDQCMTIPGQPRRLCGCMRQRMLGANYLVATQPMTSVAYDDHHNNFIREYRGDAVPRRNMRDTSVSLHIDQSVC
ncbi:uncharacterized protein A4U43_C03F18320 [Asparagus officinalis]|uniref:Wall-associated receptor kinase galacturonan-binding domain-containing protein n=1 Tax=Asparagus officinalis TaxID=4686 RepID=A0A5P1FBN7_ASPOF|nr:uncharacterized protein A4U43_C03F18320 [Asparagus officinalis]